MGYYLKRNWKINIIVITTIVFGFILQIIQNFSMMWMTQQLIDLNMKGFVYALFVVILVIGCLIIQDYICTVVKGIAIKRMNNQVREDMGRNLLQKTYQEFHVQESGQYLSWFTNDVAQIETLGWNSFFDIIGAISKIVLAMISLTLIHWSLVLLAFILAIIVMKFPRLFIGKIESYAKIYSSAQEKSVAGLKDLLSGYDILSFFGKQKRFIADIKTQSEVVENPKYELAKTKSFWGNIMSLANIISQASVLALIGFLAIKGEISVAVIMGGGNLCGMIYNSINQMANLRLSISASKPYFEKIKHNDCEETKSRQELSCLHNKISMENISFQYDKKPILDGMNCTFEIGKKYALIGPSGCGKSTLLKILLGWLPDYTGTILLDDKDAKNYTTEQLQQQMSYIEQDVFLFNTTIRENITLGENFTESQLQKALHDSALAGDLASMPDGLDTIVGEEGRNLSGGQKQRVAIARALIHNRSILLVDEGTSALDQKNADIVEQSLLSNPDLTLILISHHLTEEGKRRFDKVYELKPVACAVK